MQNIQEFEASKLEESKLDIEQLEKNIASSKKILQESKTLRENTTKALNDMKASHPEKQQELEKIELQMQKLHNEFNENQAAIDKLCKPGMLKGFFDSLTGRAKLKDTLCKVLKRTEEIFGITQSLAHIVDIVMRDTQTAVKLLEDNNNLLYRMDPQQT